LIVRARLEQANFELERLPDDKSRRQYLKDLEKEVFSEYEDDMRDMTITQGRLLIKLIDRETSEHLIRADQRIQRRIYRSFLADNSTFVRH